MKLIIDFFRTSSVKQKILDEKLPEMQLFLYFYFVLAYDVVGCTQQWFYVLRKTPNTWDIASVWMNLAVTLVGLIILFISNSGHKGRNFLAKYFSFSFTVGIKYAVIFAVLNVLIVKPGENFIMALILNVSMVLNIAFRIYQTRFR